MWTKKSLIYALLTDCIHDFIEQLIKYIPCFGKFVYIHLKKKGAVVNVGKGYTKIILILLNIKDIQKIYLAHNWVLRNTTSFTQIAWENNTSVTKLIRIFNMVSYSLKELPRTVSYKWIYMI